MNCFVQQVPFRTAWAVPLLIGFQVALSQSEPPDSQAVLRVEMRDDYFRGRFGPRPDVGLLREDQPANWQAGSPMISLMC